MTRPSLRVLAIWVCTAFALGVAPEVSGATEENAAGGVQGSADAGTAGDPWEAMNRPIFQFNESLDLWVLEPVAKGWDFVVPELVQGSIGNFFDNLSQPMHLGNELLQFKLHDAVATVSRVIINTGFGVGGLIDVASMLDVPKSDEDFGQTLGAWGVPPGPYLVLPLFGPSNPRDTVGRVADTFSTVHGWFVPFFITFPAAGVDLVNDRADVLEEVAAEREAAFDFYSFVRNAQVSFRENQVRDRAEDEAGADDDLYYFEDEDE